MHPHSSKFSLLFPGFGSFCTKNLFILFGSLIQGKTVNLYELKDEAGKISEKHQTKPESHYKRITRFFCRYGKTNLWECVLGYALTLLTASERHLFQRTRPAYLDGTEWSIGKFKLHCLFLAVDYKGVAVPVYFKLYNHKGVLSEQERIGFVEKAKAFCKINRLTLIADREFIGDGWFTKFSDLSLGFVIRLRRGLYKNNTKKDYHSVERQALKKGKASTLTQIRGLQFRLWIVKNKAGNPDEPLLYILTNIIDKRDAPDLYRLRWRIESLFKHLKTNGYNLEDVRMKDLEKTRLLVSVVVLAFVVSVLTALKERKKKQVKKKKYKNGTCFDAVSVFKQGQSLVKQRFVKLAQFLEIIQSLKIT
jgi:hypothetical protein